MWGAVRRAPQADATPAEAIDGHHAHDSNEPLSATANGQYCALDETAESCVVDEGHENPPSPQVPDDDTPVPSAAAAIYDGAADAVELLATDPAPMVALYTRKAMAVSGHTLDIVMPDIESAGSTGSRPFLHRNSHGLATSTGHHRSSAASVTSSQDHGSTHRRDPWLNVIRRRVWILCSLACFSSCCHDCACASFWCLALTQAQQAVCDWKRIVAMQVTATFQGRARVAKEQGMATPRSSVDTSPTAAHAAAAAISAHGKACVITPANDGADDMAPSGTHTVNSMGMAQPSTAQLPSSLVYKRLIQRFQRPMKAPDESSAVLTVRPMCAEIKVVDKIESQLDQQLAALDVLDTCVTECRAAVKPRLKETVQARFWHATCLCCILKLDVV